MKSDKNSTRLQYSKEIDSQVEKAVSKILNQQISSSSRIEEGEFNYVYRVKTEDKEVVARVFSHPTFPAADKMKWIDEQLRAQNVPHSALLYCSKDDAFFPYGFMISEFIEGENGMKAIKSGQISPADFFELLGTLLRKVHSAKLKHYGTIENGDGSKSNLIDFYLEEAENALNHASVKGDFGPNVYTQLKEKVNHLMRPLEKTFEPTLVHTDATPDNTILTPQGELVLVDWDGAQSSIWVADLAIITYSGAHLSYLGPLEQRQKTIREAFLKGYGPTIYTPDELNNLETALHIIRACTLLPYYAAYQNNSDAYQVTKKKLLILI